MRLETTDIIQSPPVLSWRFGQVHAAVPRPAFPGCSRMAEIELMQKRRWN